MIILIEQLQQLDSKVKGVETPYWSFWVRFMEGPDGISVSGWRYWPDRQSLSTPSVYKGGRYWNMTKVQTTTYNRVKEEIERLLNIPRSEATEPQVASEAA